MMYVALVYCKSYWNDGVTQLWCWSFCGVSPGQSDVVPLAEGSRWRKGVSICPVQQVTGYTHLHRRRIHCMCSPMCWSFEVMWWSCDVVHSQPFHAFNFCIQNWKCGRSGQSHDCHMWAKWTIIVWCHLFRSTSPMSLGQRMKQIICLSCAGE